MNVPPATLEILQCGVCMAQLSRGPVYLQLDGAALCGMCFTSKRTAMRNKQYEALAQLVTFPCKYKKLGCAETVPFVQGDEAIPHEEVCKHRECVCPVFGSVRCDWLGPRVDLLNHCWDQHPDLVLQNPCTLKHDVNNSNEMTFLLCWLEELFLFHVKVSVITDKLYHSVFYLGRSNEAKDFSYKLHVKRKDESILKIGEVMPQGYLVIDAHTALSLNINSLCSVLGALNDTTFTIKIQRRVRKATAKQRQVRPVIIDLPECDAKEDIVLVNYERYSPERRACTNQGCSHQAIDTKCRKHEWLFCQRGSWCVVCWKSVKRGSLFTHRNSACRAVTCVCSSWRPKRGRRWCLVSGAAGTAVCGYDLLDAQFDLDVYVPVASERLREFQCVVRVTQSATGVVRTYMPSILFNERYDWCVNVQKTEFPSWDCVFNVSVDVIKIVS